MSESERGAEGNPSGAVRGVPTPTDFDAALLAVQHENPELYFAVMDAIRHDTQRRILHGLVQQDGRATYDDLEPLMTVSRRSMRKHAKRLEEHDILTRIDANVYLLQYESTEAEALTKHALNCWYNKG